jgi:hypothetical protein
VIHRTRPQAENAFVTARHVLPVDLGVAELLQKVAVEAELKLGRDGVGGIEVDMKGLTGCTVRTREPDESGGRSFV